MASALAGWTRHARLTDQGFIMIQHSRLPWLKNSGERLLRDGNVGFGATRRTGKGRSERLDAIAEQTYCAAEDSSREFASYQGRILPKAFAIVSRVRSRSKRSCPRSHQPSERPKKRQRRRSVSAVIAGRPATISPMRCAGTPIFLASRYLEIPMGLRNSSISISPGLTGGSFLTLLTTTFLQW